MKVSSMLSRVVPGMAVTIARFFFEQRVEQRRLADVRAAYYRNLRPLAQQHTGAAFGGERGASRGEVFYPCGAFVRRYVPLSLFGKI